MTEFTLHRYEDVSGVSGTGDVAWGVEWPDGAVAIRWPGEHPSTAVWNDIRDAEDTHGHGGKTVVKYVAVSDRLLDAYQLVMRFLLNEYTRPITVGPHPDHADRLRLTFLDEPDWRYYVALLDGSTYAATHEEVNGGTRHRWIDPSGSLWLEYSTPLVGDSRHWSDGTPVDHAEMDAQADDNPLTTFDREDR